MLSMYAKTYLHPFMHGCRFKPKAVGGAYYGAGPDTMPIHMDDVICQNPDLGFSSCTYKVKHNCRHHEDLSIVCAGTQVGVLRSLPLCKHFTTFFVFTFS